MTSAAKNTDNDTERRRLVFFFSFGGSLTKWAKEGILSREIRLLEAYIDEGVVQEIALFSYDSRDHALVEKLRETHSAFNCIFVLTPTPFLLARAAYSVLGPWQHRRAIAGSTLLRTNQISGSWSAVIAKLTLGIPLALRLGYLLSRRHRLNGQVFRARISAMLEYLAFTMADAIIVTSDQARERVQRVTGKPDKVHLVPTYVDTETFVAKAEYDFSKPILYVGRLTAQKNLHALIEACAQLDHPLHIVGTGEQLADLRSHATKVKCEMTILGTVPNEELAELLHEYTVFVLPSLHEGLPKALIEAMGTGMICVGTNVPGTIDIIEDGKTGYLTRGVSADAIADALKRALAERRRELGEAARQRISDRFSLKVYINSEGEVLRRIASGQSHYQTPAGSGTKRE